MGKAMRENCIRTQLEKVPNWECFFVNREKGLLLVFVCGRRETSQEATEHRSDVEGFNETW